MGDVEQSQEPTALNVKTLKGEEGVKGEHEEIEECDRPIQINEDAVQHISGYSEEETMKWINEFEMQWIEDNQIQTLGIAPKKRSLTPYLLFATDQRRKLPDGGKGTKVSMTMK